MLKQTVKFVPSLKQSRENWQIIRKLLVSSGFLSFVSELKTNQKVIFNCNNIFNFKDFINFQYYAIRNLTTTNFSTTGKKTSDFNFFPSKYKIRQSKLFETKVRLWLDDFYIGNPHACNKRSVTMIKCSKLFRAQHTNFSYF